MESWPILLGWPAIIVALALSVIGIIRSQSIWLFVAAVLLIPISLYLSGSPRFGLFGLMVPFFMVGAGVALRRRLVKVALALYLPVVAVLVYLAVLVAFQ